MAGKPKQFASPQDWLEHYSVPVPEAGCWLFTGGVDKRGYGKVGVRGVTTIASRASYEMFNGSIPSGLCACHRCDVPLCINPKHLFLGTQLDNLVDMDRKNRRTPKQTKTTCKSGHALIVPKRGGQKICPICQRQAKTRYRARLAQRHGVFLDIAE